MTDDAGDAYAAGYADGYGKYPSREAHFRALPSGDGVAPNAVTRSIPQQDHYRAVLDKSHAGCTCCGHGAYFTVVSGLGDDQVAVGTSWASEELAQDVAELMSMAYDDGWCDAGAQVATSD